MAGDWIPIRTNLDHQPEVYELARLSGKSINEVVGILTRLWCWASEHTEDGNIAFGCNACVTHLYVDVTFLDQLVQVGWLHVDKTGVTSITIPKWDTWLSESAKKRAKGRKRVALHRLRKKEPKERKSEKKDVTLSGYKCNACNGKTEQNRTLEEYSSCSDVTSPSCNAKALQERTPQQQPENNDREEIFEWLLRHFGRLRMDVLMEQFQYQLTDVHAWQAFEQKRGTRLMVFLAQRYKNPAAADSACKQEGVKDEAFWLRIIEQEKGTDDAN